MSIVLDWEKYREKAVEAVREGVVLVENRNGALPLDREREIAVFGRIQLDYYKSGTGSGGMVNVSRVIGIPEGLLERGAKINRELLDTYKKWVEKNLFDQGASWGEEPWSQKEMPLEEAFAEKIAGQCGTALVVIGRTAGEEMDNSDAEGSYLLTRGEEEMLRITRKYFEKQVVVLNVASILDMSFVDRYAPDAVLYAWQGGMMGGLGTADVLLGLANPCGRLTDTVAYRLEDYPASQNFGDPQRVFYCEDIYVGYRYFETFAKDAVRYPFGYGLSYTEFSYRGAELIWDRALSGESALDEAGGQRQTEGNCRVEVTIVNTGTSAGKEIAQVYCQAPRGKLGKPERVLCGYAKTGLLQPGESERLKIEISEDSIASYDDSGVTGFPYANLLEAGQYRFYVGKNVREAAQCGAFTLEEAVVLRQLTSALAPVLSFDRMVNREGRVGYEPAPLSKIDEAKRREQEMPGELAYTGDLGIRLADVAAGKHSLQEFVAQLTDEDLSCIIRGEGMGSPKVTAGTAAAFGGVTDRLSSLGIPCGCCADGPSGIRLDCGTKAFSLPGGTLLACTWNRELLRELFAFVGIEMSANHVECLLGPGMNIHRHPLNGRNFEYFSEDPLLTGETAAAQLEGLHSAGVTGTMKHFCGNNQETGRHTVDSVISERALREIYLKGFEIAVKKGKAETIMTTYGSVNGLWTAGSFDLNTVILRGEWGFTGFVMTDWWANINRRGQQPDKGDFAAMAMAQNDVYMVCSDGQNHEDNTLAALKSGDLKRAELQRNAQNILGVLLRTHAMERLMGTAESIEIVGREDADVEIQEEVPCYLLGDSLEVDLTAVKASRGSSYSFVLDLVKPGRYEFTLTASSDVGELAQIPVTVFSMGTASGTFTWNGTGGRPVSFSGDTYMFSRYTTIRLYFAQGGLDLRDMRFRRLEEKDVLI